MKYYLIAGEASGDLHGSNLMRGLLKSDPAARFRFWGGDRMAEVGGAENRVRDYRETSFFGIVGVLRNLGTISRQLRECREDVLRYAPDVLILVDYPGFNMKMARFAKEHGIRTFYYIAPKVWAWREWRVKAIRRYVDRLYIIFPFERDYFPRHGITPVFEGNPLLDAIAARSATLPSREEFGRANGLDERPVVALVAGSRRGEIEANLPLMCALAPRFPHYQFVVTGVSWLDRGLYDRHLAGTDVRMVVDQTYETLAAMKTHAAASANAAMTHISFFTMASLSINAPGAAGIGEAPRLAEWKRSTGYSSLSAGFRGKYFSPSSRNRTHMASTPSVTPNSIGCGA